MISIDSTQRSEVPLSDSTQRSEVPLSDSTQRSEVPSTAALRAIDSLSPFSKRLGLQAEDLSPNDVRLRLPASEDHLNHQGAVHEGALFSLAQAAALLLGGIAFEPEHLAFVTKKAEIRYRRPGRGDLWARAQLSHDAHQALLSHALTKGKADAPVVIEITDQAGERVADATVTLSLRRS